jgi:hypothetical protein
LVSLLDGPLAQVAGRESQQVLGGTDAVFIGNVERASGQKGAQAAYF